jgi:hypothetical protein
MLKSVVLSTAALVGILAIWVIIVTLPVQLLWNWLVPVIFGLPKLGFLQTAGLLVLANLLSPSRATNRKKG